MLPNEILSLCAHRLSQRFVPTLRQSGESLASLNALLRGGFVRQSSAGVFTLLPNGERVKQKLVAIIDQEMLRIGASKLSLPTLLSSELWQKSGRWDSSGSELFRLRDRKEAHFLLSPTHEEEVTALVGNEITSWRQLPLRLYQIGRKFRDEARPRAGLLRGKEFLMKDLYTFDTSKESAIATYNQVSEAYFRIFRRIGLPFQVAEADSGNIGGALSHEYQYASSIGEDKIISCPKCQYSANVELAKSVLIANNDSSCSLSVQMYYNEEKKTLFILCVPASRQANQIKLSKLFPNAEEVQTAPASVEVSQIVVPISSNSADHFWLSQVEAQLPSLHVPSSNIKKLDFLEAEAGDLCWKCGGTLESNQAIEVGHTFYLGTKYSQPLKALFTPSSSKDRLPIEMGCYGIGISRLIGAIAELATDEKGISWPLAVAPFRVLLLPLQEDCLDRNMTSQLVEAFGTDEVLMDDRFDISFGTRINEVELVGYPFVVIMGKSYKEKGTIEIKARSLQKTEKFSSPAAVINYIAAHSQ